MQRILIIGSGGAGKSTLARQLGQHLNLEVIHLDQHFFAPNWVESDKKLWTQKVQNLLQKESWVMDGNYGGTMDLRIREADTIIFLDISRWLCLWRVLKRAWKERGRVRVDMAPGCKEKVEWQFLWYIFSYPHSRRPGIMHKLDKAKDKKQVIILQSPQEVSAFLQDLNMS